MNVEMSVVLNVMELHGLIRPVKQIGNWYQCYCPFHSNGQERRPSFGVLMHTEYKGGVSYSEGFGHCFTCGYKGNLTEMLSEILSSKGINQSGVEWLVANVPGYDPDAEIEHLVPTDVVDTLSNKYAIQAINKLLNKPSYPYVTEEELATYRFTIPYMYERKLTDEIIEAYDVGYDANWIPPGRKHPVPCITFPVRDISGNTLFLCRRSVQGKLYNYPAGVTKPVYGIDMIEPGTKSVIVTESCINALTAVAYGYSAVALLGTGNSYQLQQLKELGVSEFVLCFDGDDAGRRATEKLKRNLRSVAFIWTVNMPDGKDLNDLDKETFDSLYAERS